MSIRVLVLFYSHHGATAQLAHYIARGINAVADCQAILRKAPSLESNDADNNELSVVQAPDVTQEELKTCHGLAVGSPSYFGGIAAPLKAVIDNTTPLWLNGQLCGKPACVFTSSATFHGGQEAVLLSLMIPLLHHGMLIMGLPYTEPRLNTTVSGGTPYGASHVAGNMGKRAVDEDEKILSIEQGKRLAEYSKLLTLNKG